MNLEDIQSMWKDDCQINQLDITAEVTKIPKMHSKYYNIYINERIKLRKYQADYKKLKLEKYEFLINPTEEKLKLGWKIPPQGRLLKGDTPLYIDGDTEILNLELKTGIQHEKVDFLKSILDSIHSRNFLIKNIIDDRKFMSGE